MCGECGNEIYFKWNGVDTTVICDECCEEVKLCSLLCYPDECDCDNCPYDNE